MPHSAATLVRRVPLNHPATPDVQLLREFGASRSEEAFAELVRRHGPMVLAACRRVLGNSHDADDAFQAAFLVLARKAESVRGSTVTAWLYTVAVRAARGVRIMRDRRRKHEAVASGLRPTTAVEAPPDQDLAAVIDEELTHLSEQHRAAVVLCELRGLSRKEAAAELGIPEGTLSSRLAAARRKLAERLSARGLAVPAAIGGVLSATAVSARLMAATVQALRGAAQPIASAAAATVVKAMLFDQLKAVVLAAGVVLSLACGSWAMTGTTGDEPGTTPAQRPVEDPAGKFVAQLGSADFAEREEAEKALRELGAQAEPALRAGLKSESPEVRERAAKVLAAIRADLRNAFAKKFDPKTTDGYDHPVWKRYASIAGDSRASRELFAKVLANPKWFHTLDRAEADPTAAGHVYRVGVAEIFRDFHNDPDPNPEWPCNRPEEVAYLLLLGSHADPNPPAQLTGDEVPPTNLRNTTYFGRGIVRGEGQITHARGLPMGLEGKFLDTTKRPNSPMIDGAPGTDRVFAKLLAAWLAHRTHPDSLWGGFHLATAHNASEVLPVARIAAANKDLDVSARCYALMPIARFGTPADRPLFEALFANRMVIAVNDGLDLRSVAPPGAKPVPPIGKVQARDFAAGHALLLFGEHPADHGFTQTREKRAKPGERPDVAGFLITEFAFPTDDGDKARFTAHAMVKTFLAAQKKAEPPTKAEKFWPHFAKVAGESKEARALFDAIAANPQNLELLEKAEAGDAELAKLYFARRDELYTATLPDVPGQPGVVQYTPAPLADAAGWLLLGTYPGTRAAATNDVSLVFLKPEAGKRPAPFADVLKAGGPPAVPLRKLFGAWLATRGDDQMAYYDGLPIALQYDVPEALPVARRLLKDYAESKGRGAQPFSKSRIRALSLLTIARYGTKADAPAIEAFLLDGNLAGSVARGTPKAPETVTIQVRDAAAVAAVKLLGGDPGEFGLLESREPKADPFDLNRVGFATQKDRDTAHEKVRAWLDNQKKPEEKKPDPAVVKLVEQLGSTEFAEREAAQKELRKLGFKAEDAIRAGLRSESAEVVKRCGELLDAIRTDLLGGKESPVWQKFKAVAGDDADAWKLYLRATGTRTRAEMLLKAVGDPKAAAASYAKESEEIDTILGIDRFRSGAPAPRPPGFPDRKVTSDDLTALLFLGTLPRGAQGDVAGESGAVVSHLLYTGLRAETKVPFAKLWVAWTEPRSEMWHAALNVALTEKVAGMAPVARKALLAAPEKAKALPPGFSNNEPVLALRFLGFHGTADDLPLVKTFLSDKTECDRIKFSMVPGGSIGPWRPAVKDTDVVAQVRDVAAIAALQLSKQRHYDFGFETAVVQDGGPPPQLHALGFLGFCRDADREEAHKKAQEFFDKQKEPTEKPAKGEKVWPHFAKVVGSDKDSRALFDLIVANPKNLELLERAAAGDRDLVKLYRDRRNELNSASSRKNPDGETGTVVALPVDDIAGWLLLGTYADTKVADPKGSELGTVPVFLQWRYFNPWPLGDALDNEPTATPLRKLVVAWLENRADEADALAGGLTLAAAKDIPGALPAARRALGDYAPGKKKSDRAKIAAAEVRCLALLAIGKFGTVADLPALEARLTDDEWESQTHWRTLGGKKPAFTTEVRDVALAMVLHLRGGKVHEFGFLSGVRRNGEPVTDPFILSHIGFASDADRDAAHKKAREWLSKQAKVERPEDQLLRLDGHTNVVTGVAFFPGGDRVLTTGDATYRTWDVKTGKEVRRGELGSEGYNEGGPAAVAPDGKRIAVRYFVADPTNTKFLFGLEGHIAAMSRIRYSDDGKRILTASYDGTVRLWEADTGKLVQTIEAHMGRKGAANGFGPPPGMGGKTGFGQNPVVGPGGRPVPEAERIVGRGVRDAALSPDGKRIISGGVDGTVRVWDVETKKEIWAWKQSGDMLSVAFLPDGKRAASGGAEGTIWIWDVEAGKELKKLTGHTGGVDALAASPDGRLVSAGADTTVRVWDVEAGREVACFRGHTGPVSAVAVSPDGKQVLTGSEDKTARLWALPVAEK